MATPKYTFAQFKKQYPDDAACLQAILERRYGQLEACPNCGIVGKLSRIEGRRAYACQTGCHIYPCAGTIFEHSSTSLTLWFHAMYLMTATRNGVSAKELERQLGVTYKCAWRIGHQLRDLMAARDVAKNPGKMKGHVEIDETYIGGQKKQADGDRLDNKVAVMGMIQRGGQFKGHVVASGKKESLLPHILHDVERGTMINTDTASAYKTLKSHGYKHETVNHFWNVWARGKHHTQSIEGFWSHLKKGIKSTHVSVSKKHMQRYVNEFGYRYNNRHAPAEMFNRMLAQISGWKISE
jgi:transposase-like protein